MYKCELCMNEKELVNSHIIPELFYKPLYDNIHRFFCLSTRYDDKNLIMQKGLREKLLCNDCEQFFSKYENYCKQVFFGGEGLTFQKEGKHFLIRGINYNKLKLFQLSLLWRSGVSKLEFFKDVKLGFHAENIRRLLLNSNPGKFYEYGVLLIMLKDQNQAFDQFIYQPDLINFEGFKGYRFILGSALWLFLVTSHNHKFPASSFFLQENGDLRIKVLDISQVELLRKFAIELDKAGKLNTIITDG